VQIHQEVWVVIILGKVREIEICPNLQTVISIPILYIGFIFYLNGHNHKTLPFVKTKTVSIISVKILQKCFVLIT